MKLRDRVRVWRFFRWVRLHYWRGVWRRWYWRSMTLEEAREVAAQELGCPGHFIAASQCHYRRHTQIGDRYRVSTIGNYCLPRAPERTTIGASPDSFFETMVFETFAHQEPGSEACGCRQVKSYSEIDCRRYATAGAAQAGHEAMVKKYARRVLDEAGKDGG